MFTVIGYQDPDGTKSFDIMIIDPPAALSKCNNDESYLQYIANEKQLQSITIEELIVLYYPQFQIKNGDPLPDYSFSLIPNILNDDDDDDDDDLFNNLI